MFEVGPGSSWCPGVALMTLCGIRCYRNGGGLGTRPARRAVREWDPLDLTRRSHPAILHDHPSDTQPRPYARGQGGAMTFACVGTRRRRHARSAPAATPPFAPGSCRAPRRAVQPSCQPGSSSRPAPLHRAWAGSWTGVGNRTTVRTRQLPRGRQRIMSPRSGASCPTRLAGTSLSYHSRLTIYSSQ